LNIIYHLMAQIQYILSGLLNGNQDCIDMIMKKKNMIEQNETLFYHIINGLQMYYLYSYTTIIFNSNGKVYYELITNNKKPRNYIEEITIYDKIESFPKDKELYNGFFDTIVLNKIDDVWNYSLSNDLKEDNRFCTKVLIGCIGLNGFILVRETSEPQWYLREATLKEKIRALHVIVEKYSIGYLDLIKIEYEMNDILHAIILTNEGYVESIMGGGGEIS